MKANQTDLFDYRRVAKILAAADVEYGEVSVTFKPHEGRITNYLRSINESVRTFHERPVDVRNVREKPADQGDQN
jgi:hypothetical protein